MQLNLNKFIILAKIVPLEGFQDSIMKEAEIICTESRKESGCEMFLFNTIKNGNRAFVFYEVFTNELEYQHHRALAHTKAFLAFLKGKIENDFPAQTFLSAYD
ncbi:putative quinol monooxygenase [Pedobacter miscanthi]|uniref:ABM domain-containing protein n=1 Tax=Pedobacter miscanthi TaxID=2259170 RepID=A0A366KYM4_9SPHI|nr:antibiotic biosynthesis monooxygenase [Pedobacter miscanthi]RBQ06745.1 hypothetical protein DRW42_13275 [Pedobacter miscanthi]